ncbi:hypothetical protein NG895_23430 [Aeoliella sp. ICT_H6.2]|uniref:Lipoprotein n=1 Tax=Aeoliella straminimaris TaxID=2954799 RepID=A0A9X2FD43_9BACT|nr:hypothetical protein [Aeoliella straminimaris]MCO6046862.1 hypothetical protein [Aeoliella straminimaris]
MKCLPMRCLIGLGLLVLVGCDVSSYVPTQEKLLAKENPTGFLLDGADDVNGVYGNLDVDCVIYTATYDHLDSDAFWKSVAESTSSRGWKLTEEGSSYRAYKLDPSTGEQELRIAHSADQHLATIGWIQIDARHDSKEQAEGAEQHFASTSFWPRFEQAVKNSATPQ